MANEMTRRNFIKGAAAAAIAVSLSGVLTGCGDNGCDVGDFRVYPAVVGAPWDPVTRTGSIKLNVKVKNVRSNVQLGIGFKDVFKASAGDANFALTDAAKNNSINLLKGQSKDCALEFTVKEKDKEIYDKLVNGDELLVLTITLSSQSKDFAVNIKEKQVVPVEP